MITEPPPSKFRPYTRQTIFLARQWSWMSAEQQEAVQVLSHVMPFRTNQFVLDQLIDWHKIPDDPIFRLTFPQRDMLPAEEYAQLRELVLFKKNATAIADMAHRIQMRMNPRWTGQETHSVPVLNGVLQRGLQHKYEDTVQFFPGSARACHAHCSSCGRPPQFGTMETVKLDARAVAGLVNYLHAHPEVSDVLVTGGDPLVMPTDALAECIEPLLAPELAHVRSIRINTRSVAWWPHRFVTADDAGELLRLFERVVASGKRLAVMGHYSHPVELRNEVAQQAVRRLAASGTSLWMQGPLMRNVNDDAASWAELWGTGIRLGAIPHNMFVGRDMGRHDYFSVPLARAHEVFHAACRSLPGLAGVLNGPSMSIPAGKVALNGIGSIHGEQLFALQFLAARNPDWVRRPFFARFDPDATGLHQLVPAFGRQHFFFETADADDGVLPAGRAVQGSSTERRAIPEPA